MLQEVSDNSYMQLNKTEESFPTLCNNDDWLVLNQSGSTYTWSKYNKATGFVHMHSTDLQSVTVGTFGLYAYAKQASQKVMVEAQFECGKKNASLPIQLQS